MSSIKFGTDGWRAIIADEYTVENVIRVSEATAQWLKKNFKKPVAIVGYDCRFGGKLFSETVAKVFAGHGIKTLLATGISSTPMVSLGVVKSKASIGVVITASHNPPEYNGFKLKGEYGGPLLEKYVKEIEAIIPEKPKSYELTATSQKLIEPIELEGIYCKHVEDNFDIKLIKKSGVNIVYDSMYGAGQNVMKRLFPDATLLHCIHNPGFGGTAPEPIDRNLGELRAFIRKNKSSDVGLATDGDADRIGLYNAKGDFVDSHLIILILINYLTQYKKMSGKVCVAFSVTEKVKKMCAHYNLPLQVVKVGFKYVCDVMISEDTLLGGEESGGIAIKGHIPERDGIWIGLTIIEYMARTGKTLDELVKEALKITGKFAYRRIDLHLTEKIKQEVLKNCNQNKYKAFGKYKVKRIETIDGFKFFFNDDTWLMIRASGTEPVLRTYSEAPTTAIAEDILAEAGKLIISN
ncbi:MAG TPA: phosphoglucomutase/phosphomannomutase family protein [Bacteroidia bacterium]|jgi:phosphomannomutase|nr:phosphoglucomutase/phosphomannomutase family protein [Bacteroidia bacterium]